MNNTVIIDHNGLFIHVDSGYPGSFHDVNILRQSDFHKSWRQFFRKHDEVREFVLGKWRIGGLKRKWKRMLKTFDCTKQKFPHLFQSAALLTNFIHRRRMNMYAEVGEAIEDVVGWFGDE
jgi:hypothetical protein